MITKFSNSIIIYRALMMRYIFLTGYIVWDFKKQQYIAAPNYMLWNTNLLLSSVGLYPILLSIHLVNKYFTEPIFDQPAKLISYMIGWGECIFCSLILVMAIWFQKRRHLYKYILNQLFTYDSSMAQVHTGNGRLHKHIRYADRLMLLLFVMIVVMPFSFVGVLTLNTDETHQLIEEWLEINLKWKFEYTGLLFFLAWGASNCASVIFFALVVPLFYLFALIVNLDYLQPTNIYIDRRPRQKNGRVCLLIRTKGFGVMSEEKYVQILRTEGVMNRMFMGIYRGICVSAHHFVILVIFLVITFLVIRQGDSLAQEGILITLVLFFGITLPIFIEYLECTEVGQLNDASKLVLKMTRNLTSRKATLHKFVISCEVLRMDVGYPFYSVSRETFTEFLDQAANSLFNMLAM